MMKKYVKELKIHIILLLASLFIICKYCPAPVWFSFLDPLFSSPIEGSESYEVLSIVQNLSLAYIASLIFYLIVDYIPKKEDEIRTFQILLPQIANLYFYMNKATSYFRYVLDLTDNNITDEQSKKVDKFSFPTSPEFVIISSEINGKKSALIEFFDGKKEVISYGNRIKKVIKEIYCVLSTNRMTKDFILLLNEVRRSRLLETITETMSSEPAFEIKGYEIQNTYVNFYKQLSSFLTYEDQLCSYNFPKTRTSFRKATTGEIAKYLQSEAEKRKEYPYLDEMLMQLNPDKNMHK